MFKKYIDKITCPNPLRERGGKGREVIMLADVVKKWGGRETSAIKVYQDVFQFGKGFLQNRNDPPGEYKANPIAYYKNVDQKHGHYRILFEDEFEDILPELQQADFCIVNGLTYFGRKNLQEHASKMFAMIFDLDGVTDTTLNAFLNGAYEVDAYPVPQYIVLSGHGVHLYYLFQEPIPLFPNLKIQLKELKYALTDRIWNSYTSTYKSRQKQGINQGFRVIGGKTKTDAPESKVRAFKMNVAKYTLDQLDRYVPDAMKVDTTKLFKESKITQEEARQKYPEWYERVVIQGDKTRSRWRIEEKVHGTDPYALYHWWLRKIQEGAAYNHRYFCVMCLAIYAVKCNLPQEQLIEDAFNLIPFLDGINPEAPFTKDDVKSALECFDYRYCTFPIKDIETISAIPIQRNRRNGQKQKDHLEEARAIRDIRMKRQGRKWTDGNGRPSKEQEIREYMIAHPDAKVSQVARALGVSRTTVYKFK